MKNVFTPGKLTILMDAQAGSSGKGKVGAYICQTSQDWTFACNAFMPNAGHTVQHRDGKTFFYKTFNSCAAMHDRYEKLYIGPGAVIHTPTFFKELEENNIPAHKVGISPMATILQTMDSSYERGETDLFGNKIITEAGGPLAKSGSTAAGCGAARARKVLRHKTARLAKHDWGLREFICDVADEMMWRMDRGEAGLMEIAQGFQLSNSLVDFYPHCLSGDSRILMADGTTEKIRDLQNRVGEHVMTRAADGSLTTRPIINWWRNQLGNRKWYNVVTATSAWSEHDKAWYGAKFTGDHRFNTTTGEKCTTDLKIGDRLYTTEKTLERDGLQIFLGSMLGDGCVCAMKKSPQRASLQIGHGPNQDGYCEAKAAIEAVYLGGGTRSVVSTTGYKPGNITTRYESAYDHELRNVAVKYGCYGRKAPNMEAIVKDIDWPGLAIWYQDDGYLKTITEKRHQNGTIKVSGGHNVVLYTNGFTWSECSKLAAALSLKFGLRFSVWRGQKGAPIMVLSRYDHNRWFTNIAKYIHPTMVYKLPTNHIQDAIWAFNDHPEPPLATEEVKEIIEINPQSRRRGYETCFDIEIKETHNFFVSNHKGFINTHNCTSRNCTVAAGLDDMMIPPYYAGNVILNFRTYPIRTHNDKYIDIESGKHLTWPEVLQRTCMYRNCEGLQLTSHRVSDYMFELVGIKRVRGNTGHGYHDQDEIDWEDITKWSGSETPIQEMSSVTKLPRRAFTFSQDNLEQAIRHNRGNGQTMLVVNFVDYVDSTVAQATSTANITDKVVTWLHKNFGKYLPMIVALGTGPCVEDTIEMGESWISRMPQLTGTHQPSQYQSTMA